MPRHPGVVGVSGARTNWHGIILMSDVPSNCLWIQSDIKISHSNLPTLAISVIRKFLIRKVLVMRNIYRDIQFQFDFYKCWWFTTIINYYHYNVHSGIFPGPVSWWLSPTAAPPSVHITSWWWRRREPDPPLHPDFWLISIFTVRTQLISLTCPAGDIET